MFMPTHDDIQFYAGYLLGPFAGLVLSIIILWVSFTTNRKDREKQRAEHREDINTICGQHQAERLRDSEQQQERNAHNDRLLEATQAALNKCQDNERLQWNRMLLLEQARQDQGLSSLNLKVFDKPDDLVEGEI